MPNWKAILRDVSIIWGLTAIGGLIIGLATAGRGFPVLAIAISNILLGTIGFVISGCITKLDRFRHLFNVAIGVWLTSLVNVFFLNFTLGQWFMSLIHILMMMGIGGGISFLFVKDLPEKRAIAKKNQ